MTEYEITVSDTLLSNLLSGGKEGLGALVESVLNQVLESQAEEQLGAGRYERSEGRTGYRNGYRARQIYSRVGPLVLRVPQFRDGSFSTEIFQRYQRSEQALVLALMEMVVNGVSTRKVSRITEELCGTSFSKSTVSRLCAALDARVRAWSERPLGRFPFLLIDALYVKVREEERIVTKAALLVSGVNDQGYREVLGLKLGDSESEGFWRDLFEELKDRGLEGVAFVVSDEHKGLVAAIRRCFQGVVWQRCQVHFMRNVLAHTPSRHKAAMIEGLKRIFRAETAQEAREKAHALMDELENKAPRAVTCLEEGLEDALAVLALPEKYRRRLKSTNMQERLIQEIRRRERVIRIFPNEDSAERLIGALLAEIHEEWQGRRYLDMSNFHEWWEAQQPSNRKKDKVVGINH
ncbi:MAG: IS256 family transposase [Gammaproteobacteria bacterium]|nr:MAG: IS256 family transposase [Gammaproteobacteria bacterium]